MNKTNLALDLRMSFLLAYFKLMFSCFTQKILNYLQMAVTSNYFQLLID